jgi:hypothetical protein
MFRILSHDYRLAKHEGIRGRSELKLLPHFEIPNISLTDVHHLFLPTHLSIANDVLDWSSALSRSTSSFCSSGQAPEPRHHCESPANVRLE